METMDPSDLLGKGYTEEPSWERDFGKAYRWPSLVLVVGVFAGLITVFRGPQLIGLLVFSISFVALIAVWCFVRHSKPVSPVTGKRLSRYLSVKPTPREASNPKEKPIVEGVYVDHDSKKFYRVVFLENNPTGSLD